MLEQGREARCEKEERGRQKSAMMELMGDKNFCRMREKKGRKDKKKEKKRNCARENEEGACKRETTRAQKGERERHNRKKKFPSRERERGRKRGEEGEKNFSPLSHACTCDVPIAEERQKYEAEILNEGGREDGEEAQQRERHDIGK